jgi:hypothetical protein
MRGFAMVSEREDMLEISEKIFVGDAWAKRWSRKRGDETASRRISGNSVFVRVSPCLWAENEASCLVSAVFAGDVG